MLIDSGKSGGEPIPKLNLLLARLLQYGTWLAFAVTALGLFLNRTPLATVGIGLFILLPMLRVTVMLAVFIRQRDYRFVAIASLVLLTICAGCALGLAA